MHPLRWTEPAREDLRQIRAYIARDSRIYASRMIARIRKAAESIRRFPEAGSRVEEWDQDDIREIYVGYYRVIYRVTDNEVQILTVIHGARRLSAPQDED